jgi:hypothetical protein
MKEASRTKLGTRALTQRCQVHKRRNVDGDKTDPIIPAAVPVSATTLARSIAGADVPMPNVLSTRHLARIGGGLLYAATSSVPWAPVAAAGSRCAPSSPTTTSPRRILAAMATAARAPPPLDSSLVYQPAFA